MIISDLKKIGLIFLGWRIGLFVIAFLAPYFITSFGGRFPYYKELLINQGYPSWIWSFGNFDGVHYINIAKDGYLADYSQAFFPLYPLILRFITYDGQYLLSGIILSSLFYLVALFALYFYYIREYKRKTVINSILLLSLFPTSFYFGAVYTESLFLLLVVMTFLLIREKLFFYASMIIALATATKVVGIFLVIYLLIEMIQFYKTNLINKKSLLKICVYAFISLMGILGYMLYLKIYFNDPLYFLNAQPVFGASRTAGEIILLPQVIYRYFKIFFTVPIFQLSFWNALLEFVFSILSLSILVYFYKKVRLSLFVFIFGCLVIPTLTGTFSSMPRYVLMLFPLFPLIVEKGGWIFKYIVIVSLILQIILLGLYSQGYWVA